jgi:hypothetical protein
VVTGEVSDFPLSPDELAPNQTKAGTLLACNEPLPPDLIPPASTLHAAHQYSACPAHAAPFALRKIHHASLVQRGTCVRRHTSAVSAGLKCCAPTGQLRQTMNRDDLNSLRSPDGREDTGT